MKNNSRLEWSILSGKGQILAICTAVCAIGFLAMAAPAQKAKNVGKLPLAKQHPVSYADDHMLVVVHNGIKDHDLQASVSALNGTITNTMKVKGVTCLTIQLPKGTVETSLKQALQDRNFDAAQRDFHHNMSAFPQTSPLDPLYSMQWHLASMNVPQGWTEGGGADTSTTVKVGIIDTGVDAGMPDFKYAKTNPATMIMPGDNVVQNRLNGYNGPPGKGALGSIDLGSSGFFHGTMVTTTGFSQINNGVLGASPAYAVAIYPENVYNGGAYCTDEDTIVAIINCMAYGCKLINFSSGCDPPYSIMNPQAHPVLYMVAQAYYKSGGLFFNAAGNSGLMDNSPKSYAFISVTALDQTSQLAPFSNFGTPMWFTAPGVDITSGYTLNGRSSGQTSGTYATADGTSFSSPLACSIAAQIWGLNPSLSNAQVLSIMANTANKALIKYSPQSFGYGEPNSGAACSGARGQ